MLERKRVLALLSLQESAPLSVLVSPSAPLSVAALGLASAAWPAPELASLGVPV